jgi:hypothetical protein
LINRIKAYDAADSAATSDAAAVADGACVGGMMISFYPLSIFGILTQAQVQVQAQAQAQHQDDGAF